MYILEYGFEFQTKITEIKVKLFNISNFERVSQCISKENSFMHQSRKKSLEPILNFQQPEHNHIHGKVTTYF